MSPRTFLIVGLSLTVLFAVVPFFFTPPTPLAIACVLSVEVPSALIFVGMYFGLRALRKSINRAPPNRNV